MSVRHPRAIIETGGGAITPMEIDVTINTLQSSGQFRSKFPIRAPGVSAAYWASASPIPITILVNGIKLFIGQCDSVETDLSTGIISISGRDKSAGPNDKKAIGAHRNKKRSDIVKEVAGRHGLKFVGDASADMAGLQYKDEFDHIVDHISDWTLVQQLAELDGKVAFIQGDELHYKDSSDDALALYQIFYVPPTPLSHAIGNWTKLSFSRNVQLSKTVKVKVASWNAKKKQKVEAEETVGGKGGEIEYRYRHPNLNQGQAKTMAGKKAKENARHEITCEADVPGDASFNRRSKISVTGTGTVYDQTYEVDSIHHRMEQNSAYRMVIRAKSKAKGRGAGSGKAGSGAGSGK